MTPENRPSQKETNIQYSNHGFSGAMLVSGGVSRSALTFLKMLLNNLFASWFAKTSPYHHFAKHKYCKYSSQIVIFHQPGFSWNKGSHFPSKQLPLIVSERPVFSVASACFQVKNGHHIDIIFAIFPQLFREHKFHLHSRKTNEWISKMMGLGKCSFKHINFGKSPYSIGNTSSFMVDFPASHSFVLAGEKNLSSTPPNGKPFIILWHLWPFEPQHEQNWSSCFNVIWAVFKKIKSDINHEILVG